MKQNTPGHRVKEIYVLVAIDEEGDEGIPAVVNDNGETFPCIGTSAQALSQMLRVAPLMKLGQGALTLLKFSHAEVLWSSASTDQGTGTPTN